MAAVYLAVDFRRRIRIVFVACSVVLSAFWIFVNMYGLYYVSILEFDPYVPGKTCSIDSNGQVHCPDLRQAIETMKAQTYSVTSATLVGFLPSIALFFIRLRSARKPS